VLYNVDIIDDIVAVVKGIIVLNVEMYIEDVYAVKNAYEVDSFCTVVEAYKWDSNVEKVPIVLPMRVDV
jgi:hypothetical protein